MNTVHNKRGFLGFSLSALFALLLLLAVACQGRGTNAPEVNLAPNIGGQPTVESPTATEPNSLPSPLEALRGSSAGNGRYVTRGDDYGEGLPNNRLAPFNGTVTFYPVREGDKSLDASAYAIYRFDVTTSSNDRSFTTSWKPDFSNWDNLYYGLSNWESNSWDWMQTDQGQLTDRYTLTPYMDENQQLLVVVLLNYGTAGELKWLFPGFMPTYPEAELNASPVFGAAPLVVEFDATGSFHPTGVTEYEWDKDGDGVYEDQNSTGIWSTTYDEPGEYNARVQVSNEFGNSDNIGRTVTVMEHPIYLSWDPTDHDWAFAWGRGTEEFPHRLNTLATKSDYTFEATDLVTGEIIPIESLTWHLLPAESQAVEFSSPGVVISNALGEVAVYASDGEGNRSNSVFFEVFEYEGDPPIACFTSTETTGVYPLRVDFDHSCSSSASGDYYDMWFEWVFDGDGVVDRSHMGDYFDQYSPQPSFTYHETGDFQVELFVYDDYGNWDSQTTMVSVTGSGPQWHFTELDGFASYEPESLVEVNGKPAATLFYSEYSSDGDFFFVSAVDSLGTEWSEPTLIDINAKDSPSGPSMSVFNGVPVGFYSGKLPSEQYPFLWYVEAQNPAGTLWGDPQLVTTFQAWYLSDFLVVGGKPCVVADHSNSLLFIGYDGVSGENGWFENEILSGYRFGYLNTLLVDGNPAIVYNRSDITTYETTLEYIRALDATGQTWGSPLTLLDSGTGGHKPSLQVISGIPCISYNNYDDGYDYFVKSLDATGGEWDVPVRITPDVRYWNFRGGPH